MIRSSTLAQMGNHCFRLRQAMPCNSVDSLGCVFCRRCAERESQYSTASPAILVHQLMCNNKKLVLTEDATAAMVGSIIHFAQLT